MFKIFNKVIWKTPVGYKYYPVFHSTLLYYYVGSCKNKISKIQYFIDGFKEAFFKPYNPGKEIIEKINIMLIKSLNQILENDKIICK